MVEYLMGDYAMSSCQHIESRHWTYVDSLPKKRTRI